MGTTFFELRRKALGLDEGKSSGKNFVEDFFDGITDNVKKESSRIKLEAMGASEGLIEAILGAGGWEQVYNKVIKGGIDGLKELQKEFSQTAAGIDELTEAIREAEKAQEALREAIEGAVNEQLEGLKKAAATAQQTYDSVKAAADDFRRWSLENITTIQVLPDVEKELGSFESAIVSTIANMQSELQSAVRSGLIQDSDFNTLRNWVATETTELANLARSRDDLAERYSLSEALISEYQKALTGSLKLTSLFSKLKDETEESNRYRDVSGHYEARCLTARV
jgi:DNA repair exonuclease SbcCD ATPase subunit